ncbi:MAG: type I DNA topoisomerase [Clostridia bacterium]|nr:type I DNA topoisomerase [Clostridia bacterium]
MADRKKTLVIVESPSKAKTISKYLGQSYTVMASVGHIRDLPKSKLGIDIDNNFEPQYIPIRGKGDLIKDLKKAAKDAKNVILATDPDREGEAISWHLAYLLGIDPSSKCRVTFNEITEKVVKSEIKNPRAIDLCLVDAQQARRVLDRIVGYQISPLLWRKIKKGLSAGRVQSAALKIICDREREVTSFVPKEYWNINVDFKKGRKFTAKVSEKSGSKLELGSKADVDTVISELGNNPYKVSKIEEKVRERKPFAPFTTSSLQQDAANKLNFPAKKTMMIAQQLYEGVEIKGKGTVGLVTYIRTDSVRISDEAKKKAKEYITKYFGAEYSSDNFYSNRKKEIQDAHEAIRPSYIEYDPDLISSSLSPDQLKLYKLIWTRFLASQMSSAVFDVTQVEVENGNYLLKANGTKLKFDGYQKIYSVNFDEDKDKIIPNLSVGEELQATAVNPEQKFTEPPSRFTEASLIKELEDKNIGRPSTYAPIVSTLVERSYIGRKQKALVPTELGFKVTDEVMSVYFKEIVDVDFTSDMENRLDKIEGEGIDWKNVVKDFYTPLKAEIETAEKSLGHIELSVEIAEGEFCDKCGKPMAIKSGRFGEFLACTGYPECKTTRSIIKKVGVKCPDCGGDIVAKRGAKGKLFYGCSNYPSCNRAFWYKPTDKICPECGSILLERAGRNTKYSCSNDNCKHVE